MSRIHLGVMQQIPGGRYVAACGLGYAVAMSTDRRQVTCLRCPTMQHWTRP